MISKERLKILCVEDDKVVADYISSLLDKELYTVKKINDGKKALDFILQSNSPADIIILDYYLPSMNGIEILEQLKLHKKNFPVIFLTVDETLETAVKAMNMGAIDYLAKSSYLKVELNIKIEKAYQLFQERLKKDYYEENLAILRLAIEQSYNSIMITDKNGDIEYVNKMFTQTTGYTFEEIRGKNPRFLKTENYDPNYFINLWQTISSGKSWQGDMINRRKNGEEYFEKTIITPIRNKAGAIVSYLGIKEDITDLKKIECALIAKKEELDNFFAVVADLLCITDMNTHIFVRLNNAWTNIFGYSIEEMLGKRFIDYVHPDDIDITSKAGEKLRKEGKLLNFTNRYRCKDGKFKFIEWSSITHSDGKVYSSARDITQRMLNEQALKESESRFRSIFEVANAGIFISDKNGIIVMANNAYQEMIGFTLKELYQIEFTQLTHYEDMSEENKTLKLLIEGAIDQYRIEKRYIKKKGDVVWVDLAISVIRDEDKKPIYYVGVAKDISQRKLFEEQLQDINNNKDKFFSIIAHDLRGQFSVIENFSELILQKKETMADKDKERYMLLLQSSGRNALALLENLLEWSRIQLNKFEFIPKEYSLYHLVEEVLLVIENQAAIKNIEIFNNINPLNNIYADKNMIETVLRNLLNNAVKYTPTFGRILIKSESNSDSDIVSVEDTGVGMTPEILDRLFKIEWKYSTKGTEKEKGSGLGLILCKEFVDKHGGKIMVSSIPEKGSIFSVILPKMSNI